MHCLREPFAPVSVRQTDGLPAPAAQLFAYYARKTPCHAGLHAKAATTAKAASPHRARSARQYHPVRAVLCTEAYNTLSLFLFSGGCAGMIYENILKAVGHTPMVRLNHMTGPEDAEILVKVEGLNVGGSIKTRTALNMIEDAEQKGLIGPGSIIVEPTSGNQGIGLALVGAVKGYKTVIIMPDCVSIERRKLVEHYGAEVITVHDDGDIGACIQKCLDTATGMAAKDPRVFVPQQFNNPANPMVHRHHTALEILEQVAAPIHGYCSGIGTGGTLSGIGEVLKAQNPDIVIWAVEPEHAAILAGGNIGTHLQMGIGDGLIPENLNLKIFEKVHIVTDEEAIGTARDLARKEGLLCGISSGSNVAAAIAMAKVLGKGKTIATILPDTAERYFSTPLFAEDSDEAQVTPPCCAEIP